MISRWILVPPLAVAGYALLVRPRLLSSGATPEELAAGYPGDNRIAADSQTTMAVTLSAPPEDVWPWLAQMDCNRAGWYSWDHLDNRGRPSSRSHHTPVAAAQGR